MIESGSFLVPSRSFLMSSIFGVTVNNSNSILKGLGPSLSKAVFLASEYSSRQRVLLVVAAANDTSILLDLVIMVCNYTLV